MNPQTFFKILAAVLFCAVGLAAGGTAHASCDSEIRNFCTNWENSHMQFSIPECVNSFQGEFSKGKAAAQTHYMEWHRSKQGAADYNNTVRDAEAYLRSGDAGLSKTHNGIGPRLYACASKLGDNQSVNLEEGRRAREREDAAQGRRSQEAWDNAPKGGLASVEGGRGRRKPGEQEANAPARKPAPCPAGVQCGVQ